MTTANKSSAMLIFLAWLFVGIPAAWGVYNTVHSSMKLFQQPAAGVSAK
jgi:hypothetical protein